MAEQPSSGDAERERSVLNGDDSAPELKNYLAILRRRIWAAGVVFVIVVTLGTVHAFKATPVYRAEARLLIEKRAPRVVDFQDVVQWETSDRAYYRTQAELLLSRDVLRKALQKPGMQEMFAPHGRSGASPCLLAEVRRTVAALLGTPPAPPPEPWQVLRGFASVEPVRDSHLLAVVVEGADPERSALVANAVARSFEEYHLESKMAVSDEAFSFLHRQAGQQEQRLIEAQDALQQFREDVRIVSLDVNDRQNPVFARLGRLSEELTEVEMERVALAAQLDLIEESLAPERRTELAGNERLLAVPQVRLDATVNAVRTSLVKAEQDAIALADVYGEGHPQMQAARAKTRLLHERLADALQQVAGSLAPQLEALRRREDELRRQHEQQNETALALAKQSLTYGRLQSEVERQRRLFEVLVERMREVDLAADYGKTNVALVEPATPPSAPVRPRKIRIALASVLLGAVLGTGLAFLLEHMDDTVQTPEDLEERVGVPVLGFVPAMNHVDGRAGDFANRGLVCALQPGSSASEAYRSIRTSLFFAAPAEQAKALVVTSGGPGDGKTTTATNLALTIAQSGKSVLLIDADFRRPMIHRVFDLDGRRGVSTVLVGEATLAEAVQTPRQDGEPIGDLHVLAAGPKPPNPAELLDSDNMRRLLQEGRERYDRVLIDTPPVLFVADASILSGICDGVIMVVKSAKNTRALATRTRERLDNLNARVLGGVLNDVHLSRLGTYYSEYYHYGYSRYYRDYYGSRSPSEE
jgi:capsular exopolysaccharide synthesis family protein